MWVYSWGHPFSLLVDSTLQRMDEALVDGFLALFPRLKGRKKWNIYSSILTVGLLWFPELWDPNCFLFRRFLLPQSGLGFIKLLIGRTTIDFGFCTHNFVCGLTINFKNIWTLKQRATGTFSNQKGFAATPSLACQFDRWQPLSVSEITWKKFCE